MSSQQQNRGQREEATIKKGKPPPVRPSVDKCNGSGTGPIAPNNESDRAISARPNHLPPTLARVGHLAPDFQAHAFSDGHFLPIKLSNYTGKWVVLCFYPGDFTYVCPTELAAIAARFDEITNLDVQPLAISTDSRFSHKIWQDGNRH